MKVTGRMNALFGCVEGRLTLQGVDRVMGEKRKNEPLFGLDMDFGEALERFVRADPKEVAQSVKRSKQERPPENAAPDGQHTPRVVRRCRPAAIASRTTPSAYAGLAAAAPVAGHVLHASETDAGVRSYPVATTIRSHWLASFLEAPH